MGQQIELKEGDVIVSQAELNELFAKLETAEQSESRISKEHDKLKLEAHNQTVLISHTIFVVAEIEKVVPGLFSGKGLAGINFMSLMSNKDLEKLGPHCEKLKTLITNYKGIKPVILNK